MTHKELKQYVANKRKAQAKQWAIEKRTYGECTPPTVEEYEKYRDVIITGKKSYKTKFVHNKLWSQN
jgi:hypothetical protein|tara:strand:+ start:375 stop:575 length:201 start_codon:yes stop_codon:yes gene_type:complete